DKPGRLTHNRLRLTGACAPQPTRPDFIMKLKIIAALAVIALVAAGFFVFQQKPAAPDVAFPTLEGQTFRTADLRGKVVLVNFWATTCTSCIKEMPALKATQEKF